MSTLAKGSQVKKKASWCSRRRLVHVAGAITGLIVFGWLSIALVYFAAQTSEFNPILIPPNPDTYDLDYDISSLSPIFTSLGPIEVYKWQISLSFADWTWQLTKPAITTAVSNQDWRTLYQWANGAEWLLQNEIEYDFRAQNDQSTFWNVYIDKPLYSLVPLPNFGDSHIEYFTMDRFHRAEYEEDLDEPQKLAKFKKFQGFIFRASDQLQEFPGCPQQGEYKSDLLNRTVSLLALSTGSKMQPSVSLSGRMIMQISGISEWAISPPSQLDKYHIYPFLHPLAQQSQLNFTSLKSAKRDWNLHSINNGMDINAFSEGLELNGEEKGQIEALYGKLAGGRLLYIPPLWIAYQVASSTSITAEIAVDGDDDMNRVLHRLASGEDLAPLINTQGAFSAHGKAEEDPEKNLRARIESLLRVLTSVASSVDSKVTTISYLRLFDSYERFHSHLVGTKHGMAYKMTSSICSDVGGDLREDSLRISLPLPAPHSHTQASVESLVANKMIKSINGISDESAKSSVMSHTVEAASFAFLQDTHVLHSFLHECTPLWLPTRL